MSQSFYFNINYTCNSHCLFCASRDLSTGAPAKDMPVGQFKDTLLQNGIKAGDRVIINGGEPTIHMKFFSFLEIVNELGAYPVLFTNGIRLHDVGFTKEIISFQPINIRIPFFGATAADHDRLTGNNGNFAKTLQGFGHVVDYIGQGASVDLEAKLLLSKSTYRNNLHIAKLLIKLFPNNFYFSINPLIFSEKVLQKKEMFLERFAIMKPETDKVIRHIQKQSFYISLNQVPFCVFQSTFPELFPVTGSATVKKLFFDTTTKQHGHKSPLGGDFNYDHCSKCLFYIKCNGFYPEYLSEYGSDEVYPYISNM